MNAKPDALALEAGALRHSIEIQSPAVTQDALGSPTTAWQTVRSCRASIELAFGQLGRQDYAGGEMTTQTQYLVTARYAAYAQVRPGYRVVFGDKQYLVQAVVNVGERNRVLRMLCLEIDGAAS